MQIEDKRAREEFLNLLEKVDSENPDQADIVRAETMIRQNPDLYSVGIGVTASLLRSFLKKISPQKSQQLLMEAEALRIKKDFGYSSASQAEKLLIEQIILCWAGANYVQACIFGQLTERNQSINAARYWQETLTRSQARYLKAVETLARVRKLNQSIAVQFNIAADGGQQINVNELNKKF